MSKKIIKEAEQFFGFQFPIEYLNFVLGNYENLKKNKKFRRQFKDKEELDYVLDNFFDIESVITYTKEYIEEGVEFLFDKCLIHIGNTISNPIICLGVSKSNHGKVFVLDDDFGLTYQSESIVDFIASLEEM